ADTIWIRQLLLNYIDPGALYCENVSATYLAARTKHLEMDFHFVRERVKFGDADGIFEYLKLVHPFGSRYAVLDVEPTCDERDEDDAMQTDISEQTIKSLSSWRP
ncbi:cysteine-rich RLK (RECEPTOR-like protein kinase) 8, partial [Striga hermonthica]